MQSIEYVMLNQKEECDKVLYFFLSKVLSPKLFEDIQKKLLKDGQSEGRKIGIEIGAFSLIEFGTYYGKFKTVIANIVLKKLDEKLYLIPLGTPINGFQYYHLNETYLTTMNKMGVVENQVYGFPYIMKKYRNSVFKIENTASNEEKDIGTGYYTFINGKHLIITNEHVIAKKKSLRLLSVDEKEFEFKIVYQNNEKDLAFLELVLKEIEDFSLEHIPFRLKPSIELLQQIITIGYPRIPQTKEAYQLYHQGEVNSQIEDYRGNKLFLISAKTSSGNSGSPVIDETGLVLGTITRELFEKDALQKKGKLPYYAVIPTIELTKCLAEVEK